MARRKIPAVSTPAPAGVVSAALDVVVKHGVDGPPVGALPKGSRVLAVAPALPKSLRTPEADLLRRSFQIVLPASADPAAALRHLREAEGVESATAGPQLELPR